MTDLKDVQSGYSLEAKDVLVTKRTVATTKKGGAYLRLAVRDAGRELEGVAWDYDPIGGKHHEFAEGDVIRIWATVDTYNGALQLNVTETQPSDAPMELFGKRTEFDVEEMWSHLVDLVGSFKEPLTKYVAEELLLNNAAVVEALKKAPAAKLVHNDWFGGLLEHVWSLCQIAEPIITHYQNTYLKHISRDKVLFGLMLHDAGKILEYDYTNPAFPYTGIGTFTNHMVLGPAWVYERANKFRVESLQAAELNTEEFKIERAHLMHVLAAHHGCHEWGSPVVPASIEAILVHHLDNLDSKVMHAMTLIKGPQGPMPGFSERSWFEKTCYYQPC